jgi:hypothetical protein
MIQPRLAAQHDIPVDDGNPHRHAVDFYDPEAKRPRLAIVNRAVDKRLQFICRTFRAKVAVSRMPMTTSHPRRSACAGDDPVEVESTRS